MAKSGVYFWRQIPCTSNVNKADTLNNSGHHHHCVRLKIKKSRDVSVFHCRCVVCACSAGAVGSFSNKPLSPKTVATIKSARPPHIDTQATHRPTHWSLQTSPWPSRIIAHRLVAPHLLCPGRRCFRAAASWSRGRGFGGKGGDPPRACAHQKSARFLSASSQAAASAPFPRTPPYSARAVRISLAHGCPSGPQ